MVILPLNVQASFPKWFPDFVKFEFKYSNKLLEMHNTFCAAYFR